MCAYFLLLTTYFYLLACLCLGYVWFRLGHWKGSWKLEDGRETGGRRGGGELEVGCWMYGDDDDWGGGDDHVSPSHIHQQLLQTATRHDVPSLTLLPPSRPSSSRPSFHRSIPALPRIKHPHPHPLTNLHWSSSSSTFFSLIQQTHP